MGVGTGHKRWGEEEFRENSQQSVPRGAKYRCRARSTTGDGEWNERRPLSFFLINDSIVVRLLSPSAQRFKKLRVHVYMLCIITYMYTHLCWYEKQ